MAAPHPGAEARGRRPPARPPQFMICGVELKKPEAKALTFHLFFVPRPRDQLSDPQPALKSGTWSWALNSGRLGRELVAPAPAANCSTSARDQPTLLSVM